MPTVLEDFLSQNVCKVLHITDFLSEIWREREAETVKIPLKLFHKFPLALGCYFKDKYSIGCLICLPLSTKVFSSHCKNKSWLCPRVRILCKIELGIV